MVSRDPLLHKVNAQIIGVARPRYQLQRNASICDGTQRRIA